MTQTATTANKSSRTVYVRASFFKARATLQERGNLFVLILSSLLLLVVAFAVYFAADLLAFALDTWTALSAQLCSIAFYLLLSLFALLAVLPLLLGWLRLALLIGKGEAPMAREMTYYMASPRRYGRALLLSLLFLLVIGLPVALASLTFYAASFLSNEIQVGLLAAPIATLKVVLIYLLAALPALVFLCLEGFALPVIACGIKEEKQAPFAAILLGLRLGARYFGRNLRFLLALLVRVALSVCTLGILWIVYAGPACAVAYLCYAEELT